jgi:outer membrane usher protein
VGHTRGSGNRRTDASIEGSIIGWSGGLALGQPLGETVGIVDAPGYSGASIDGQMATRTDARGRAVVSYLTPYRVNRLGLDSIKLGDAYDYDSLFREVVPTSGAVLVVPINPVEAIPLLP